MSQDALNSILEKIQYLKRLSAEQKTILNNFFIQYKELGERKGHLESLLNHAMMQDQNSKRSLWIILLLILIFLKTDQSSPQVSQGIPSHMTLAEAKAKFFKPSIGWDINGDGKEDSFERETGQTFEKMSHQSMIEFFQRKYANKTFYQVKKENYYPRIGWDFERDGQQTSYEEIFGEQLEENETQRLKSQSKLDLQRLKKTIIKDYQNRKTSEIAHEFLNIEREGGHLPPDEEQIWLKTVKNLLNSRLGSSSKVNQHLKVLRPLYEEEMKRLEILITLWHKPIIYFDTYVDYDGTDLGPLKLNYENARAKFLIALIALDEKYPKNHAMMQKERKGGIDLEKLNVSRLNGATQMKIQFKTDPAMLRQLRNASGLQINIRDVKPVNVPMLNGLLGLNPDGSDQNPSANNDGVIPESLAFAK